MTRWTFIALVTFILGAASVSATAGGSRLLVIALTPPLGGDFTASATPPPQAAQTAALLEERSTDAAPPKQRSLRISRDRIVVVGMNSAGDVLWQRSEIDPRFVRAEFPDSSGHLSRRDIYRNTGKLSLAVPDDPALTAIRVLKPRWTGNDYALDKIVDVPLPRR